MFKPIDKNGHFRPIPNVLLKQLESKLTNYTHRNVSVMTEKSDYNWVEDNRPCIWSLLECDGVYKLLYDHGYGYIALAKGMHLLDVSAELIVTEECVAFNPQTYGAKKGIWR